MGRPISDLHPTPCHAEWLLRPTALRSPTTVSDFQGASQLVVFNDDLYVLVISELTYIVHESTGSAIGALIAFAAGA